MSLRLIITRLEDVPAAWRSEYIAMPDGRYELDCVGPLKNALRQQRTFAREMEKFAVGNPELQELIRKAKRAAVSPQKES